MNSHSGMIPKNIHYCWFGGGNHTPLMKRCIESWRKHLPEYELVEWNESNSPMSCEYVASAYENRKWFQVSNYVRLFALYAEGGIYFDTDIEALKSFDPLLDNGCFFGFQQQHKNSDWVNNAVIGSTPQHQFIHQILVELDNESEDNKSRGPDLVTSLLTEMGLKEYGEQVINSVKLYPAEYFYPYPWWANMHPARITERTFAIHHWQLSWHGGDPRSLKLRTRATAYNITSHLLGATGSFPALRNSIERATAFFS